jgi:hypothetical protein
MLLGKKKGPNRIGDNPQNVACKHHGAPFDHFSHTLNLRN